MQIVDLLSPVSATSAAIAVLLSVLYYFLQNRDVLPGPTGLPYFGLWPFLKHNTCHLQMQNIGKKYGDLYSFRYGGKLLISLGSAKAMREALVNKADFFNKRVTDYNFFGASLSDGITLSNGEAWKCLRKFFIHSFKEYGLISMTDSIAGPIYESVSSLMSDLKKAKGNSLNVSETFTVRCTGSMRKVLFGEDSISDKTLIEMNNAYGEVLGNLSTASLLLSGNFAWFVFNVTPRYRSSAAHFTVLKELLHKAVKKMESSFDENHVTCVVENYFKERNERKRKQDSTWKYYSDKTLVDSLAQFVGDGILGVAYFISIFLIGLVEHPEEQDKIFTEIIEVVGLNREIAIEDKSNMAYTNAFMNEVIRTSDFLTLSLSLECTKETTLRGYRIPKRSVTMLNFWATHHDPETYENPDSFDPSRFIAQPGKPRAELPAMFGIGKRACVGESFVMMEVFLFLTNIVKNFKVSDPAKTKSSPPLSFLHLELSFEPRSKKDE